MPRKHASPEALDSKDSSFEQQCFESEELVDLVDKLAQNPRNRALAENFVTEATDAGMDIWRDVIEMIGEKANGGAIKAAVTDALSICRETGAGSVDSSADAVSHRFQTLRSEDK